ncbi:MAG: ATP-grasp domain-containing protein [Candidatus Micrarchaeota archaeon]|nr:ATP-grasp domain-containing protein [Candidatus Micrarchaeota archaeon]
MKKILVTGCGGPAGVNFIRSLRYSGENMFIAGIDTNKYHLEFPDVDKRYLSTVGNKDPSYIEKLNEIISRDGIELVHPQPDTEVRFISENREKLDAKTFLPSKDAIRICQNKFESSRVWEKAGIPVAKAIMINSEDDLQEAVDRFGYPFWLRATSGAGGRGSTIVKNMETGIAWLRYWRARGKDWQFIAEDYLPGQNIAFQSVWKDGEIITSQARERIEYIYPYLAPSGITGTPSVAKTIVDEEANDIAAKCIKAVDRKATGVFCVDMKRDEDGKPCPTEINIGRFFTTSFFFTKAGVNMPYIYVKLAYGEETPDVEKYNAVGNDVYWIRHMDSGPVLLKEGEWRSIKI